jgi:hypothetical protein
MEHKLLWGSLALGVAGWVCLLLLALSRSGAPASAGAARVWRAVPVKRPFLGMALLLPIGMWLATLPTQPPFSSGQGWGRGFLLGGLIALASALLMFRAGSIAPRRSALVFPFGALIVVCVPLLWMRHAVIEALLGAALAWAAVSLLLLLGIEGERDGATESGATSSWAATSLLNGAAFATTLCGVAALGVYRDFVVADLARGTYSSVAVALAAATSLSLLAGVLWNEVAANGRAAGARLNDALSLLPCVVVPLGLAYLMATRVLDDGLAPFYVVAVGVGLSLLCQARVGENQNVSPVVPAAAVLVALCGFLFAFQLMQGFGVGLMLLAAWPASLLALPSSSSVLPSSSSVLPSAAPTVAAASTVAAAPTENAPDEATRPRLVRMAPAPQPTDASKGDEREQARFEWAQVLTLLGTFLAILLMSRLFATRFRADLRGAGFSDQFALFGFLAGAVLPAFLSSLWFGSGAQTRTRTGAFAGASAARLAMLGVLSLVLPGAMLGVWGIKIAPAFFAGLALSQCGFGGTRSVRFGAASGLLSLALCSVLTQWTPRVLPLAQASRAQRMHFLLWGVGSAIVLVLLVDYGARLLTLLSNRKGGARLEEVSR